MEQHPRFDLDRWSREFPLARLRDEARATVEERARRSPDAYETVAAYEDHVRLLSPGGEIVCGPRNLALIEQLRREAFANDAPRNGVPTDVFVWGVGEPSAPYLTKIGGLPFRNRDRRWPCALDGRPLQFLAQLSFVDSRDLFPKKLPGDLLLVFTDPGQMFEPDAYIVEWARADEPTPLREGDVPDDHLRAHLGPPPPPPAGYRLPPEILARLQAVAKETEANDGRLVVLHGAIHRTYDYPNAAARFGGAHRPKQLDVLDGTKLGGVPRFVQDEPRSAKSFLAAIASVGARAETRFPWINVEEPVSIREAHRANYLQFGDMGTVYLFRRLLGRVRVEMQSY